MLAARVFVLNVQQLSCSTCKVKDDIFSLFLIVSYSPNSELSVDSFDSCGQRSKKNIPMIFLSLKRTISLFLLLKMFSGNSCYSFDKSNMRDSMKQDEHITELSTHTHTHLAHTHLAHTHTRVFRPAAGLTTSPGSNSIRTYFKVTVHHFRKIGGCLDGH